MFNIKDQRISEWYYVLVALGYVSTLVFTAMRPGVFASILMALVLLELVVGKKIKVTCFSDGLAIAFFAYQMISVIWLVCGRFPVYVYTNEFVSSTLPMIFYFVGNGAEDRRERWYRFYLCAILILGIIGVAFYILAPQFYINWAYNWSYISKADTSTMRVRMHSVVGSTCLSFIAVAGMLAGSYFLSVTKDDVEGGSIEDVKKGKSKNIIFSVVTIVLCLLFAIMANQRSGLVAAAVVLVYVNYLLFFKLDMIPKKFFVYELIAIATVFAAVCAIRFEFVLKFWYRIISLPTAISQRSEQWVAAVNNMYSSWIGNGLGANGHKAIGLEDAHVIADGGLVKLYCENGVLGTALFAYLIFLSLKKGLSDIKLHYVEIGIIVVALLQSIGSNMLAFQICVPIFWFSVGSCNRMTKRS